MKTNLTNPKFLFVIVLLLTGASLHKAKAQVKIGNNPTVIDVNSLLELESTNKGLLIPRVQLTGTANATPLTAHVQGMIVFNLTFVGDAKPGFYVNSGTEWVPLADARDGDLTTDGWVDNVMLSRVEIAKKTSGVPRGVGEQFVSHNNGNIGIGTVSSANNIAKVDIVDSNIAHTISLNVKNSNRNIRVKAIQGISNSRMSANGTFLNVGIQAEANPQLNAGVTNSGFEHGLDVNSLRSFLGGTPDAGTLEGLNAARFSYGHSGTNGTAATTTNNVRGLELNPLARVGVIDSMMDIYIQPFIASDVATVNHRWSFFNNSDAPSYMAASVGIGTKNPTSKLQVVGIPAYADDAAAGTAGLTTGAFYQTSAVNNLSLPAGVLMVKQ